MIEYSKFTWIPLTQNHFSKVDLEDFERLNKFKWFNKKDKSSLQGYAFNNKLGSLARFITNAQKGIIADHVNHKTLDNRKSNLRLVNKLQNNWNRKPSRGLKGVSYCKERHHHLKPWRSRINDGAKTIYLGRFSTIEQALLVYDNAAKKYHGDYAYLNGGPNAK